jgi:hypothetical protein
LGPSGRHPRVGGPRGERHATTTGVMAVIAALVTLATGAGTAAGSAGAVPAGSVTQLAATGGSAPALTLEAQSAWVGPNSSFDLRLKPRTGASSPPTSELGLTVSVYACLSSVSGFDQSVGSGLPSGGIISSTPSPLPLNGLPTTSDGSIELSMPVVVGSDSGAATGPDSFTIDLRQSDSECQAYPSGGVFPVRVELVNTTSGQAVGGFTTHLVFADTGPGNQRLRVAVVLPVHTPVSPAAEPRPQQLVRRPSAALAPVSDPAVDRVTATVAAIARYPRAPVTVEASPQTLSVLDGSGATRPVVTQLAALSSPPFTDQITASPYAPVNAAGLVAGGLGDELSAQVTRGSAVLSALGVHSTSPAAGALGPWITNDSLTTAALSQLQASGYGQVVLPAGSVSSTPTNGSTTEPFQLATTHATPVTAVASSADLAARFVGSPGNPVLAAHQLVAELAQIYYEKPNDVTPRATVVVAPNSWNEDPSFVDALLSALTANPILEPVTASQLLASIPVANCRDGCRLVGGGGSGGLPVVAIRRQRSRVDGFASAATGATARSLALQMGDVVLAGESETLKAGQQTTVIRNAGLAVDAQLSQLTVSGDRTVTLTSQQGTLQVTVVSTAPYPVTAVVTLTSDKLLFPNGTTQWSQQATLLGGVTGAGHTNVVPVAVRTRASGVFNVDIVMHSPAHRLELASGEMSVRSTATSVVGIVLTVGALAVLIVWWVRTSLRRRRQRRVDGPDTSAGPAGTG